MHGQTQQQWYKVNKTTIKSDTKSLNVDVQDILHLQLFILVMEFNTGSWKETKILTTRYRKGMAESIAQ